MLLGYTIIIIVESKVDRRVRIPTESKSNTYLTAKNRESIAVMYKLDLPVDTKESAAIGRRRQKELERQSRIFNAKVRTIGVRQLCYWFNTRFL